MKSRRLFASEASERAMTGGVWTQLLFSAPTRQLFFLPVLVSSFAFLACSNTSDKQDFGASGGETAGEASQSTNDQEAGENGTRSGSEAEPDDQGSKEESPLDSKGVEGSEAEDGGGVEEEDGMSTQKFDVERPDAKGSEPEVKECDEKAAGIYCRGDRTVIHCDGGGGDPTRVEQCMPNVCMEGEGCILCRPGTYDCRGNQIYECDTTVPGYAWKQIGECNPASGTEGYCDGATGTCGPRKVTGDPEPTGTYLKYAEFLDSDYPILRGACDIDTYGTRAYVAQFRDNSENGEVRLKVHVFELGIIDSDGDGEVEPDQHPDNAGHVGPIEERTLTHVETIKKFPEIGHNGCGKGEIYAEEDRFFYLASGWGRTRIFEYMLDSGNIREISYELPNNQQLLGYDEIFNRWYTAADNENRIVLQYDVENGTWGNAFKYPAFGDGLGGNDGWHMDGLEVVPDPNTGEPYVYVSDMTSDYIGQYRFDVDDGWVQENVFEYEDKSSLPVEGLGFGTFDHFWASAGSIYELGGGELGKYIRPVE